MQLALTEPTTNSLSIVVPSSWNRERERGCCPNWRLSIDNKIASAEVQQKVTGIKLVRQIRLAVHDEGTASVIWISFQISRPSRCVSPRTWGKFSPGENRVAAYLRTVKATRKQGGNAWPTSHLAAYDWISCASGPPQWGTMFVEVSYGPGHLFRSLPFLFDSKLFRVGVWRRNTNGATRLLNPRINGFHLWKRSTRYTVTKVGLQFCICIFRLVWYCKWRRTFSFAALKYSAQRNSYRY